MQEERMHVLKMVDEGKVTADEAMKLLQVLGGSAANSNFEEKFNKFAKDSKEFFKDAGNKINHMYAKAEPKIKGAARTVVSKTADLADNISQSLNEKIKDKDECCCGGEAPQDGGDEQPREN